MFSSPRLQCFCAPIHGSQSRTVSVATTAGQIHHLYSETMQTKQKTFWEDIHASQMMNPANFCDTHFLIHHQQVDIFGFEWNVSAATWWIALKFDT